MKLFKVISAALLVCAFAAQAQAQSALQDILNGGVLRVGTTGDWNPMTMKDPATNTYKGYDIDVMTELAKDLGVEIEFVPTDWKTLVSGVTSDKYHITGSASISPARAKAAGYTTSYFSLATVPLILAENAGRFKDWGDLDQAGVTVAAQAAAARLPGRPLGWHLTLGEYRFYPPWSLLAWHYRWSATSADVLAPRTRRRISGVSTASAPPPTGLITHTPMPLSAA